MYGWEYYHAWLGILPSMCTPRIARAYNTGQACPKARATPSERNFARNTPLKQPGSIPRGYC